MKNTLTHDAIYQYVKKRYAQKFDIDTFDKFYEEYKDIKAFKANENIWESGQSISEEAFYIMRLTTQYCFKIAFEAMKINIDSDPNLYEDLENGNIGTPGRLSKVYCGANLHDDTELGCGRWSKPPRIASFPNRQTKAIPITKRVDLVSNCSHHTLAFSTMLRPDSYAIVSYIPNKKVLGISKLQRVVDHISRRYWLQEDLTLAIYDAVSKASETKDVYVKLCNVVHTCESLRGAQAKDGTFTSEMYGGKFEDPEVRKDIK